MNKTMSWYMESFRNEDKWIWEVSGKRVQNQSERGINRASGKRHKVDMEKGIRETK